MINPIGRVFSIVLSLLALPPLMCPFWSLGRLVLHRCSSLYLLIFSTHTLSISVRTLFRLPSSWFFPSFFPVIFSQDFSYALRIYSSMYLWHIVYLFSSSFDHHFSFFIFDEYRFCQPFFSVCLVILCIYMKKLVKHFYLSITLPFIHTYKPSVNFTAQLGVYKIYINVHFFLAHPCFVSLIKIKVSVLSGCANLLPCRSRFVRVQIIVWWTSFFLNCTFNSVFHMKSKLARVFLFNWNILRYFCGLCCQPERLHEAAAGYHI